MKKVVIAIFILLVFVVAGELIYLNFIQKSTPAPSQSIPKTSTPQKSAPQSVGSIKFVTFSRVLGMELKLKDAKGLEGYLKEKGILPKMETGMIVLGEIQPNRPLTVEFALVAEKQNFLKLLSREETGDTEVRSVGSKWDSQTSTYTFQIYMNPEIVEMAEKEGNSETMITLTILEALYTVSVPKTTDEEYSKAIDELRTDVAEKDLKFFTVD